MNEEHLLKYSHTLKYDFKSNLHKIIMLRQCADCDPTLWNPEIVAFSSMLPDWAW